MAGRYGGRFGTNQEQEQRRIQKEPVVIWKKEWILPAGAPSTSSVRIFKYVRTGGVINFDEEEEAGEETMAMDVDTTTLVVEPLQSVSAVDSLAVTPAPAPAIDIPEPEAPIEEHLDKEGTPAAETPTQAEEIPAPAENEPIAVTESQPSASADMEIDILDKSSQPLLTQPSLVSSQEPLTTGRQDIESSQPVEAE